MSTWRLQMGGMGGALCAGPAAVRNGELCVVASVGCTYVGGGGECGVYVRGGWWRARGVYTRMWGVGGAQLMVNGLVCGK